MKLKLFLLFSFMLTSGIQLYSQQSPQRKTMQGVSNPTQVASSNNQGFNIQKSPSIIIKSTPRDTITIRFEYGNNGEIKKIESKNKAGITETFSFQYLRSKIIYTFVSANNETSVDSVYLTDGLITKDANYSYIYENRKLVEIKSPSRIGDHYTIRYDEAGNAIEQIRVIPPMMKDDDEVTQVGTYTYDETLKSKFFFSTDWYFCPISSFGDDLYGLPSGSLFGLGSSNLVTKVVNNSKYYTSKYSYLTFDESGYPTHYTISELETVIDENYEETTNINDEVRKETGKSTLFADYKITYIIPVNVINGKWGCVDKNGKQIISCNLDTATYKDFSFDGKVISCTKSGIKIRMDTAGNMLSLETNAGNSYNTICDAIKVGDVEAIKKFIDFGVDLNIQYKYRYKDQWNDQMMDGYPIDLLMNIETKNDGIRKNIAELFSLFIKNGLNINANTSFYTLLVQVIRGDFSKDDKIKMLQILIDNNANVNEIGKNGNTPLMELCIMLTVFQHKCSDVYDISKFLIEHGANPTIKNAAGNSAIKMIKKSDCYELIELLNKKEK
jgi:hypothetical protein